MNYYSINFSNNLWRVAKSCYWISCAIRVLIKNIITKGNFKISEIINEDMYKFIKNGYRTDGYLMPSLLKLSQVLDPRVNYLKCRLLIRYPELHKRYPCDAARTSAWACLLLVCAHVFVRAYSSLCVRPKILKSKESDTLLAAWWLPNDWLTTASRSLGHHLLHPQNFDRNPKIF